MSPARRPPPESATSRLSRLLDMVPWLLAHQGVPLDEAAAEFGVSTDQLVADLELLFVCGTPGGMPDDLIEADWEDGKVFLGNADYIARPLRLSVDEALALMVGLRALATTPGLVEHDAVARALSKLEEATGARDPERAGPGLHRRRRPGVGHRPSPRRGQRPPAAAPGVPRADSRRGHRARRRPDAGGLPRRSLVPRGLVPGGGRPAVPARPDPDLELLDEDGTPPRRRSRATCEALFTPGEEDLEVVVETDRARAWIVDYYPVDRVEDLGDGRRRVTLHVSDPALVRRLAWRMGGHVWVVSPVDLQQSVASGAQEALSAYTAVPSGVET